MAASLAAGIAALPEICAGAMLLLGDMPEVSAADMDRLVAAFAKDNQNVIRAVDADDQDGHPVIFPARLFPDLTRLRGDRGARDILAAEDIHRVALPGRHATRDLDTPEAWAAWQAEQSKK